jgi:membrane-associated phospholipid phosphatase
LIPPFAGRGLAAILLLGLSVVNLAAQTPTPQDQPASSSESVVDSKPQKGLTEKSLQQPISEPKQHFLKNLLRDQKSMFTAPFRLKADDMKWVAPLAGATVALLATDKRTLRALGDSSDPIRSSRVFSSFGSPYATFGTAGGLYFIGALVGDDKLKETGRLGVEALIDSAILVRTIKLAAGRRRPSQGSANGSFWSGGNSFPSGHSITIWSLATVVAEQYQKRTVVRIGAYAIASAVSASRFTGRNHFASDVFVGSALGFLIGRHVVRSRGNGDVRVRTSFSPYIQKATKSYGFGLSLQF